MTGIEQTRGQWCHCGGYWLLTLDGTVPQPVYDTGRLHDIYTCGSAA